MAGDRLINGRYEPIPIDELAEDVFQGYSAVLNLLRWDRGELALCDPATGRHIVTYEDLLAGLGRERARADAAEARVRELEAELRRLRATSRKGLSVIPVIPYLIRDPEFYECGDVAGR